MTRRWRFGICCGVLALGVLASPCTGQSLLPAVPAQSDGGTPTADASQTPAVDSAAPPVVPITDADLARIRRSLDMDPSVRIGDDQLRFYVQILARRPTFAEFAKGYDFKYGPTRGGNPMTHDEFLSMVTPKEMNSQLGITARETLEFALTNWLGQMLVKKAFEDLQQAKTDREIQEIRDRIERELALLKGAAAP